MKRSQIKKRPLADTVIAALEPEETMYREPDGNGLYLQVKPNGRKSWQVRYKKPDGKWGWHGLGSYPATTGAKARALAADARAKAAEGIDPIQDKADLKASRLANTFQAAAEIWYQKKITDGRAQSTLKKMREYLDSDILPALGKKPLDDITRIDTRTLQESIEARGAHNVAKKIRSWLNQIFGLAIANGMTENNPASELVRAAAKMPAARPHPHLLEHELPAFLRALRDYNGQYLTKTACYLIILTGLRPGNVFAAEWSWFNLDKARAEIPAEAMKMRRPHAIPLPRQLVTQLRELYRQTGNSRYLFPGQGWKKPHMSENTINMTFKRIGYKGRMTGHGSRHTASTLLNEHAHSEGFDKRHITAQLGHKDRDVPAIANVYNHAIYWPERVKLMQWYADYLDDLESGTMMPWTADNGHYASPAIND